MPLKTVLLLSFFLDDPVVLVHCCSDELYCHWQCLTLYATLQYCEVDVAGDLGEHLVLCEADNPRASHRAWLDGQAASDVAGWHDSMPTIISLHAPLCNALSLSKGVLSPCGDIS